MRAARGSVAVFLAAALAGCAAHVAQRPPAGRDFAISALPTLELGQADEAQVIAILGPPVRRTALRTIVTNPRFVLPVGTKLKLTVLTYFYAPNPASPVAGELLSEDASVVFWNGRLFSYQLHRAVRGQPAPPFDEAKADGLERGSTTRNQAIAQLGEPTGQTRIPAEPGIPENLVGRTLTTYDWSYLARNDLRRRHLTLTFDPRDVMTDMTQTDTDGAGGPPLLPIPMPGAPPAQSHPIRPPGQFQPT